MTDPTEDASRQTPKIQHQDDNPTSGPTENFSEPRRDTCQENTQKDDNISKRNHDRRNAAANRKTQDDGPERGTPEKQPYQSQRQESLNRRRSSAGPQSSLQQTGEVREQFSDDQRSDDERQEQDDGEEGKEKCQGARRSAVTEPEGGWQEERVGKIVLFGVPIVSLHVEGQERLCLAQISTSLLHEFSYNEIHNRRVALGITCLQCTPSQLEVLRRAGAMPVTSRRCGLITKREADRLVRSFIADVPPPRLPDNFTFRVRHECGWSNEGVFVPARYNSSRAKCVKCVVCDTYFSPNKFIFHCHPSSSNTYRHPDAANFNSWRRHLELVHDGNDDQLMHAWEDVKAMFNGGCRKRISLTSSFGSASSSSSLSFSSCTGRGNMPMSAPSFGSLYGNNMAHNTKTNVSSGLQPHVIDNHGNRSGMEVQNFQRPVVALNPRAPILQQMTPFASGSGSLNPMPPTAVAANTHPAFFPSRIQQTPMMSYGDYLRSMSRPYNTSNLSTSNGLQLPDFYRAQPASFLPGMFGASPHPLNYFGYPYLAAATVPDSKGSNFMPFQTQLSAFRGFATKPVPLCTENNRNQENRDDEKHCPLPDDSVPEDTDDEISVNDEDDKDEVVEEETATGNRVINNDESNYLPPEVPRKVSTGTGNRQTKDGYADGKKDDVKVENVPGQPPNINYANNKGEKYSKPGRDAETEKPDSSSDTPRNKDGKLKARLLPGDTKSLLKIFEATEDVDTFIHLPIDVLRRLYKSSKNKSHAVDRKLRKVKELQDLQRLRAEELKEELSRQFLTIKENICADIEQERKMIAALQERLKEAQKLAPQNLPSPYGVFPHRK